MSLLSQVSNGGSIPSTINKDLTLNGILGINNQVASSVPFTVTAASGQTANLLELKNYAGTAVFYVDVSGNVTYLGDEYITDQLTVNGNASIGGTLGVTGATTLTGNTLIIGSLNVAGGANFSAPVTFDEATVTDKLFLEDNVYLLMGNTDLTPDAGIAWNTAQTVDALYVGLSAAQNTFVIAEYADRAYDFAHAAQTNPTVFIQSATQSATQWGSFTHDQTDFLFTSGAGAVRFAPATNVTATLPAAGKVYINATSTANTGTAGILDIDISTATTAVNGIDVALTSTATTGQTNYVIKSTATSAAVVTGTNHSLYSGYFTATKSGADTNAATTTVYAIYAAGQNTGSTNTGTKDTYGVYCKATGDANGTSTAIGIYAEASGADNNYAGVFSGNIVPLTSDGSAIGTTARMWSDLFLASSAVINYNNGEVTLTHSTNLLSLAGSGLTITLPATNRVYIDATTSRTGTTGVFDVSATYDTTTATDDVVASTFTLTRAATDTGGTRGHYTTVTTGDQANGEWSYAYGGKTVTSACATATSNSAVFFADTPTADAQCNDYALYISSGYDYSVYSASGSVSFLFGAAEYAYLDGTSTAHTDTNGVLKVACSSATADIIGTNLVSTNTTTTGNTAYNLYSTLTSSAVVTGTSQNLYGTYSKVTKSGADTNANNTTLYGVYGSATNTGSTDTGTKNTYGGYFTASGDTAGTSTVYGIYAGASGGDTNWAGYFNGNVYMGALSSGDITISDATPVLNFKDTSCTDTDVNFSIQADATDTGSGTEDIDVTLRQQVAGTITTFLVSDADGSMTIGLPSQAVAFNTSALSGITTLGLTGDITISGNTASITHSGTTSLTIGSTSGGLLLKGTGAAVANDMIAVSALNAFIGTSGNQDLMSFTSNFAPTSGTATFQTLRILPTINQTGGANGTVTDFLINRTETALVGTQNFLDFQVATSSKFKVSSSGAVTISAAAGDTGLTVPKGIVISGAYGGTDVAIQLASGNKLGWGGDADTAWIKRNINGLDLAVNNVAGWQLLTGAAVKQTPTTTGTLYDFVLETEWTTGTIINADFASATVQSGAMVGINLDFNTNLAGVTAQNVTSYKTLLPALTQSSASTTVYTGFILQTAGALVQNTLEGTINWQGFEVTMPAITQTTGTVTAYGLKITGGVVTSGTAYGIYANMNATTNTAIKVEKGNVIFDGEITTGNDTDNVSGKINFIASDGDAADISINTSDQLSFANAAGGYLFDASIGVTGTRVPNGWFTDLTVTNNIAGSITGNAATVTSGVYTTTIPTLAEVPLATVTGINLKTVATTTLYTVPVAKTAVITRVIFIGTTIDTYTVTATASLGGNAANYNDWSTGMPPGLFGVAGDFLIISPAVVGGLPHIQDAGDVFTLNVTGGATATSGTVTAVVMGYLY